MIYKTNKKSKLKIFIPYFLPDNSYGGPIVSIYSLSKTLKNFFALEIYTTNKYYNSQNKIPNSEIKKSDLKLKINRSNSEIKFFLKTTFQVLSVKDSIIYINSFFYLPNSFPFFIFSRFSELRNNRLIISPRAELQYSKIQIRKKFLKLIFIKIFQLFASKEIEFISASHTEIESNKHYFSTNKHFILPNLSRNLSFKKAKEKSPKLNILFYNRISEVKGLDIFLSEIIKNDEKLNIKITIAGSYSNNKYFKKVLFLMENIKEKICEVNYIGEVNPKQFDMSIYDVFILPTKGENFSHSTVEASQAGLFCILSNNTPWFKNTNSTKNNLTNIPLHKPYLFIKSIEKLIKIPNKEFKNYISEQQNEIKKEIVKSKNLIKKFFLH